MEENILEKILDEIKTLKIGQQRIVGEVEVLNSMSKKLEMGQKNLGVMQQKTARDIESIRRDIGGIETDIDALNDNQEDMSNDIKLIKIGQQMLIKKQENAEKDMRILKLVAKDTYDKIEAVLMDVDMVDNKAEKLKKVLAN